MAHEYFRELLGPNGSHRKFSHAESRVVRLLDGSGAVFEEAVVTLYESPRSFTGEDLVEFSIHGSVWTAEKLLERLQALGARSAERGEFSFRAIQNGKIDLTQANAIRDLIEAKSEAAGRLALEKLGGRERAWVDEIRSELQTLTVQCELGIDFSDQDLDELSLKRIQEGIGRIRERILGLAATFERGQRIQEGLTLALIGEPNAGKSSLFNRLLGEDRAIVSPEAGTTRDILREEIRLHGERGRVVLRVLDTAGIRRDSGLGSSTTIGAIEREGIERTKKALQLADLRVFVHAGPSLVREFPQFRGQGFHVLTHSDQVMGAESRLKLEAVLRKAIAYEGPVFWVSSVTGEGVQALSVALYEEASRLMSREAGEILITRKEEEHSLRGAAEDLERALQAPGHEWVAADLRLALGRLGGLLGPTTSEDLLGQIFQGFCIGK
jgi:tRNA modification GTPase